PSCCGGCVTATVHQQALSSAPVSAPRVPLLVRPSFRCRPILSTRPPFPSFCRIRLGDFTPRTLELGQKRAIAPEWVRFVGITNHPDLLRLRVHFHRHYLGDEAQI